MSYKKEKITKFTNQHFTDYFEGKLSLGEVFSFEQKLKKDPFFRDAYEGFKSNPKGRASLPRLEKQKNQYTSNYLVFTIVSLVLLFATLALLFYFIQNREVENKTITFEAITKVDNKNKSNITPPSIQQNKEETLENKNTVKGIVGYEKIIKEELLKERTSDIEIFNSDNKEQKYEPLVYVELKNKLKKIEITPSLEIQTNIVPLVSIHGLINVNYEKIEDHKSMEIQELVVNGTPANQENIKSSFSEPSHQTQIIKVPYVTYLSNVQFDFSHNKFKKAIKGYNKILEQYPNDLNAHFYSAICYYNLNQSLKALQHLEIVQTHPFDTFRQEGNWYKASVLYDLGRTEECMELLDSIVKKDGFYAEQAKAMRLKIE